MATTKKETPKKAVKAPAKKCCCAKKAPAEKAAPAKKCCCAKKAAAKTNCAAGELAADKANAIIAASREEMKGAVLYMTCVNPADGSLYSGTSSCSMCKRLIINSGIEKVVVRETKDEYTVYNVSDWVTSDDTDGAKGY